MSKLPDSFGLPGVSLNPAEAHRAILSPEHKIAKVKDTFELDLLYLLVGLNIVSMCSHLARLWLYGDHSDATELSSELVIQNLCNGHPAGTMDASTDLNNFTDLPVGSLSPTDLAHNRTISYLAPQMLPPEAQKERQLNLFVVREYTSPVDAQHFHHQQHIQSIGFNFDKPHMAAGSPLCAHHQATAQLPCQHSQQLYGPDNQANYGCQIYLPASSTSAQSNSEMISPRFSE